MFKIIGADQKQYGPVTTAQIRQWIADGRLNATTMAQRDTGGDWQPLSAFEEFADIFQAAGTVPSDQAGASGATYRPAAAPMPTASREMALSAVNGPALALIIIGGLGVALYLAAAMGMVFGFGQGMRHEMSPQMQQIFMANTGALGLLRLGFAVVLNGVIIFGAIKMRQLQGHTFAIVTCILAMLPCSCCCFFGLPFAIWGLVVLNKPDVKSQFTN